MRVLKHAGAVLAALLLIVGLPALIWLDLGSFFSGGADAVSRATVDIPAQPSGNFLVLLNTDLHGATADQWADFFLENPVGVIMEDIDCLVMNGDAAGGQLAERYQARLAEHQMRVRSEDGLLTASKAENGLFDVIVLSREMADAYRLGTGGANVLALAVGEDVG